MARFRVYEIEHGGDESAALELLAKAGCKNIKVLGRDYEGAEAIGVECELPAGVASVAELGARCPELIL